MEMIKFLVGIQRLGYAVAWSHQMAASVSRSSVFTFYTVSSRTDWHLLINEILAIARHDGIAELFLRVHTVMIETAIKTPI
jgi:hypothetical protein